MHRMGKKFKMMLIICDINFISKCVERINEALIQIHTQIFCIMSWWRWYELEFKVTCLNAVFVPGNRSVCRKAPLLTRSVLLENGITVVTLGGWISRAIVFRDLWLPLTQLQCCTERTAAAPVMQDRERKNNLHTSINWVSGSDNLANIRSCF